MAAPTVSISEMSDSRDRGPGCSHNIGESSRWLLDCCQCLPLWHSPFPGMQTASAHSPWAFGLFAGRVEMTPSHSLHPEVEAAGGWWTLLPRPSVE